MTRADQAETLFRQGYGCCQAVAAAFAPELELPTETAIRLASGFSAGFGRLREVCGAFSALCLVAGQVWGYSDPLDQETKKALYRRIQGMAASLRQQHGSILCRELLARAGVADDGPQGSPQERTEAYYRSRPCVGFIRSAAALLEEQLAAEGRLLPFPCNDDNLYKEEP
ncbi:MAG TPA: C-GCAxxG-C-C family protein [Firmicutes bacterium]|nr:C-GCAxxG-C-C family protein [Bacillota bacterium]